MENNALTHKPLTFPPLPEGEGNPLWEPKTVTSLYIHIPFCKKKCNYCDFVSYAGKEELIEEYVEALIKEITALTRQPLTAPPLPEGEGSSLIKLSSLNTIYFGGGTPTLLEPKHLNSILENVGTTFMVVQNRRTGTSPVPTSEITIESNPGTADKAKLKALRELGINRLSIGVQSFNNRHLKTLGRIHSAEEALNFCADARAAGFDNINLDLIFALPNQTFEEWKSDLETAINLQPDHLSTYNLQIEENTPLWEKVNMPSPTNSKPSPLSRRERVLPNFQKHSSFSLWEKGESLTPVDEGFNIPSEDEELKMYEYTIETLTAKGYKHYEISNFAKSGFECQHNVNYWKNGNYLGLGAGAHSHLNGKRWSNPNCIEAYVAGRGTSTSSVESSRVAGQKLETGDPRQEALFLGLRLLEGLPSEKFAGFEKEVDELFKEGLLTQENNHYKLTRRGLYLGNLVFERFV